MTEGRRALIGILGSQSKGAWLALTATTGFLSALSLLYLSGRWRVMILLTVVLAATTAVISASSIIDQVAGPTIVAAEKLTSTLGSGSITDAMRTAIEDESSPMAMRERLMIWYNALELFEASPVFGWGNEWLREWRGTPYADVGHTLLHNGYLEILVRHGLFGFVFLGTFAVTAACRLRAAHREGVIATSTLAYIATISFFFFWTIATNSNNRLAIGESFFILAGAAVFAVTLMRQTAGTTDQTMTASTHNDATETVSEGTY